MMIAIISGYKSELIDLLNNKVLLEPAEHQRSNMSVPDSLCSQYERPC